MTDIRPTWRPSALQRQLASVAAVALAGALILGRPQLVVLATPIICALAIGWRRALPRRLSVDLASGPNRLFEGEDLPVAVDVRVDGLADHIDLRLDPAAGTSLGDSSPRRHQTDASRLSATWRMRAERWGRRPQGTITLTVHAGGGLLETQHQLQLPDLAVFPHPPTQPVFVTPPALPDRIGEHVARSPGHGIEFAGVSPYTPGDLPRRLNWPVTLRRGDLYVNRFAAERAADLVVMVDAFDDVGQPGASSLDLSVRGAAGLAQAHLRQRDRVGFVAVAGLLHWLSPDDSRRQFYRIAEQVMDIGRFESVVSPDLERLPRTALPPWALIVFFSPLLDPRAVDVIQDLRERNHPLIVIDVLGSQPPHHIPTPARTLAQRFWRLDRQALRHELSELGVDLIPWDGDGPLDVSSARLIRVLPRARA